MPHSPLSALLKFLQTLFAQETWRGAEDYKLLRDFVRNRATHPEVAEVAFAALVQRHGPMVQRVCRCILRHDEDAEDALQATFMGLARKAHSLRPKGSFAGWLHEVAVRVSMHARAARARRQELEKEVGKGMQRDDRTAEGDSGGLEEALHEEVERLPRKFREAIVLHYFEGLGTAKIAERLLCTRSAVKQWLARGRKTLRKRLTRGVASANALAVAPVELHGAAAIPVHKAVAVAKAVVAYAAASTASGLVKSSAAVLADAVLKAKGMAGGSKALWWVIAVTVVALGSGAGVGHSFLSPGRSAEPAAQASLDQPNAREDTLTRVAPEAAKAAERVPEVALDRPNVPEDNRTGPALEQVGEVAKGLNAYCLAFSPDQNRHLAVGKYKGVVFWVDLIDQAGGRTWRLRCPVKIALMRQTGVRALAFSPDGRWLAAGTRRGDVLLWDLTRIDRSKPDHPLLGQAVVGIDPDVVLGSQPGGAPAPAHRDGVKGLAFRPDGGLLASSGDDGAVRLWAARRGWEKVGEHQQGHKLDDVRFSPDGALLACGSPEGMKVFDVASLESPKATPIILAHLEGDHRKLAFSADGQLLAVNQGRSILLARVFAGGLEQVGLLTDPDLGTAHREEITSVDVSADGRLLASGGGERALKLWDVPARRLLETRALGGEGNVFPRFSPDGYYLAATGADQSFLYRLSK
jgi:RNA polymerase sigma factor (sigma-70 family)